MFSKMTPYKRKQIKEDLRDAAESTTGHVIPLIVKSRYWPMKLFYSLAWLTGFVFTILFITCGIMDYFKYDVTTKTRYVRESSMVFPKVTICNNDPFTTEASMKFLANLFRTDPEFSEDLERAVNNGVNVTSDIELANYILGLKRFDINMKLLEKAWQSDEATKKSLGYDRKTLILNCLFNVEVCTDNLTHTYDIRFGNCFTFNANKTFSSPEGGESGGLRLDLNVGKDDSYSSFFGIETGATIFIYDNDRFYTEADKIEISGGTSTKITLKKRITEMAVKPYSECIIKDNVKVAVNPSSDTELVDLFIKSEYKYNYENCYEFCYQDLLNQTCGCIDEFIPFLNLKNIVNATLCRSNDCYKKNLGKGKLFEYCHKKCPYECDIVSISRTLLSQKSPFGEKDVEIKIYYPELSYESTTESPTITGIALAGTIGGTLGLFLGFSVLSPCEGVDIIINFLVVYFKKDGKVEDNQSDENKEEDEKDEANIENNNNA